MKDPNRLHLWPVPGATTWFIMYRQRRIGQVESIRLPTMNGMIDPPILLHKPFSEQLINRIKDLVNKRDGTNRDIVVSTAPNPNHPAIQKYLLGRQFRW